MMVHALLMIFLSYSVLFGWCIRTDNLVLQLQAHRCIYPSEVVVDLSGKGFRPKSRKLRELE